MTNTPDYLDLAKKIINRMMAYLNKHPNVQTRTKSEWCVDPMIGIQLPADFAPAMAGFIERFINPVPPPETADTFDEKREVADVAYATESPEPVKEEPKEPSEPPTAYQILEFMADKAVRLNQVASRFGVTAEDIKDVVKQPNSGISIGAGGWMQVVVA